MAVGKLFLILLAGLFFSCSNITQESIVSATGASGTAMVHYPTGILFVGDKVKIVADWMPTGDAPVVFPEPSTLKGNFYKVSAGRIFSKTPGTWSRVYYFETFQPGEYEGPKLIFSSGVEVKVPSFKVQGLSSEKDRDLKPLVLAKTSQIFPWWFWGGIVLLGIGSVVILLLLLKKKGNPEKTRSLLENLESLKINFHNGHDVRSFYRLGRRCWAEVLSFPEPDKTLDGYFHLKENQTLDEWYREFQFRDRTLGFSGDSEDWMKAEEDLDRLLFFYRRQKERRGV